MPILILGILLAGCAANRPLVQVPVIASTLPAAEIESGDALVVLTEATVTFADLRLESPPSTARAWSFSPIAVAHAHPGHDFAGDVGGELLGTWTVDLLGDSVELGSASCYDGTYATGRLTLAPEPTVVIAGEAYVSETPIPFRFELAPDQEVTGLAFDAVIAAEDPPRQIVVSVDLAHALSSVDWYSPDEDGDGVLTVADAKLGNTVSFGIVSTPTWNLSLEDTP